MLGLEAAETAGWGITVPTFVKTELEIWLNYSRETNGCWGYTGRDGSDDHAHAGAGIAGLSFIGYPTSDSRIQGTLTWLNNNWTASTWGGTVWNNKYGMYAVMKGMRTANPEITAIGSHDWFAEFSSSLINGTNTLPSYKQQDAGYWPQTSTWTSGYLGDSIWSLLTLMPSVVGAAAGGRSAGHAAAGAARSGVHV